jgi:putative Mg2+ transporter-C (MgtC) family protein
MLPDWEFVLRLLVAAALGSVIGLDRERLAWAAGLRTHMLVAVGSCLAMIVSAYGFSDVLGRYVMLDPSRIAAQVISGVGFLGAGSIILRNEVVKGLTTAASLWAVAAMGLAVGCGLYVPAVAATLLILIILAGIKPLEEAYRSRNQSCQLKIEVESGFLTPELLRETLQLRASQVKRFLVESRGSQGADDLSVFISKVSSQDIASFSGKLNELDGVKSVAIVKRGKNGNANPT